MENKLRAALYTGLTIMGLAGFGLGLRLLNDAGYIIIAGMVIGSGMALFIVFALWIFWIEALEDR